MNLRERVEHSTGGLVELHGAANFECAREDLFSAFEIAKLDEDLSECRECHRQAVTGSK